jgi:predicted phosphodiesterase
MEGEGLQRHSEIEMRILRCHDVSYLLTIIGRLVAYSGLRDPVRGVIFSGGTHEEVIREARDLMIMNASAVEWERRYRERQLPPILDND